MRHQGYVAVPIYAPHDATAGEMFYPSRDFQITWRGGGDMLWNVQYRPAVALAGIIFLMLLVLVTLTRSESHLVDGHSAAVFVVAELFIPAQVFTMSHIARSPPPTKQAAVDARFFATCILLATLFPRAGSAL